MSLPPKARNALYYTSLLIFAFAVGYLSFRVSRHFYDPQTTNVESKPRADQGTYDAKPSPIEPFDATADSLEVLPTDSISDELIATFSDQSDFEEFIKNASRSSYEILGYNEKLGAVRIRVYNQQQARNSIDNLNGKTDYNYTLLTPLPIASAVTTSYSAFGHEALDFIRVPFENENAGEGIKIAVLDSGIRSHTTLSNVHITKNDTIGNYPPTDYSSHGTAVASLIAGSHGLGIAPAAELLSIRVLDSDGIGDTFTLAEGIIQAVDSGAQIINLSVASYGTNSTLEAAVGYALENDVVLVAAAGNDSLASLPYPAAYSGVIAVSAVDALGFPTDFANQSDSIDVAAPGVGVYAAWEEDGLLSFTGTSAATPYVSGAIASLASSLSDTSPSEAAKILLANANDTGFPGVDSQTGSGYIDLQRSLDSATRYSDAALSSIYLSPEENTDGSQTLYVAAQNRGTESIPATNLEITLANGITQTVYLGPLDPSQTASYQLDVTQSQLNAPDGFRIEAQVTSSSSSDKYPENDSKSVTLRPSP